LRFVAAQAKTFSYEVSLDRDGAATSSEGGSPLPNEEAWSPEHLVLAGLARCTLTSLGYHAQRDGIQVTGGADAWGEVTQRDQDGRYAFVRVKVEGDVTLEPKPASTRELVAKAERDCFVGASLTAKPRYRWTVNGEELL
jgi:organic hydroperoxide reductase OsmC/OhrA